jgi:thiol-disulfide isomerase/thioredoxin
MKKLLFLFISFCLLTFVQSFAQGEIRIDGTSVIKNIDGTQIDLDTFMKVMDTGEFFIEPLTDTDGNPYFQLRKASEREKLMMKGMDARQSKKGPAPVFSFIDMEGNSITSENTKGKVVVLNFWFTSCPPCIEELPQINALYEKFKNNKDIVFAAVTFEQPDKIEKFLKRFELKYPIVASQGPIAQKYSGGGYPTNVVLDREGNYHKYVGGGHSKIGLQLEVAIGEALAK